MRIVGASDVLKALGEKPAQVRESVRGALDRWASELASYIRDDKLSGGVLNVRSGDLRSSIYPLRDETDTSVTGGARGGGGIVYAKIHEYGGDIYPKRAPLLRFMIDGHWISTKHVHMPERSYMRSSLADKREDGLTALRSAVKEAIRA